YNLGMADRLLAAGFVLTGGGSRRMGGDKALLPLAGRPLVLHMVEKLRPLVAEVALIGAPERYAHLGLPVLPDCEAGRGPLAGIVTALRATRFDWNLIVACDLPFLDPALLELDLNEAAAATDFCDAIVPQTEAGPKGWQPLAAAYHRRCLPAFERVLASDHPKISRAYDSLRVRALTPDALARFAFSPRMFNNVNSPEDYAEAKRILEP
ncbi:MAG: molybdenum cofactor guanylyltransferase, partial [Candidatus Acidiferrales bacterium]